MHPDVQKTASRSVPSSSRAMVNVGDTMGSDADLRRNLARMWFCRHQAARKAAPTSPWVSFDNRSSRLRVRRHGLTIIVMLFTVQHLLIRPLTTRVR